jgi:hypothetical protein
MNLNELVPATSSRDPIVQVTDTGSPIVQMLWYGTSKLQILVRTILTTALVNPQREVHTIDGSTRTLNSRRRSRNLARCEMSRIVISCIPLAPVDGFCIFAVNTTASTFVRSTATVAMTLPADANSKPQQPH